MVVRLGGKTLCESCANGIIGVINGDSEIRNVRKHTTDIDYDLVFKMYDSGIKIADIVKQTGYGRTTITRGLANRKKAASQKE